MLQAGSPTHVLHVSGATHAVILGDRDRLGQVFTNLITNAVKYSPRANKVDITLSTTEKAALISVHDDGVGIAKAHQKHIFEGAPCRAPKIASKPHPRRTIPHSVEHQEKKVVGNRG